MLQERLMQPNTLNNLWNKLERKYPEAEAMIRFKKNVVAEVHRAGEALWASSMRLSTQFVGQVQELTTPTDSPDPIRGITDSFTRSKAMDTNFLMAYDVMDFIGTKATGFDVAVYNDNIVFAPVEPGENIKIFSVTSSITSVPFIKHGGGVQWANEWFEDEKFYLIDDVNRQMLGAAMREYAELGYGILETGASTDITYATTPSGASQAILDATTIWDAAQTIVVDVEDQFNVSLDINETNMIFYVNPQSIQRARTALAVTPDTSQVTGGPQISGSNITLVPTNRLATFTSANSSLGIMVLPGFETKWGDRRRFRFVDERSEVKDATAMVGTWRANGAVGNSSQIQEVPSA